MPTERVYTWTAVELESIEKVRLQNDDTLDIPDAISIALCETVCAPDSAQLVADYKAAVLEELGYSIE